MAKYRGKTVKLNKPFRTPGESKKFAVYVRDKKTDNVNNFDFFALAFKVFKTCADKGFLNLLAIMPLSYF